MSFHNQCSIANMIICMLILSSPVFDFIRVKTWHILLDLSDFKSKIFFLMTPNNHHSIIFCSNAMRSSNNYCTNDHDNTTLDCFTKTILTAASDHSLMRLPC